MAARRKKARASGATRNRNAPAGRPGWVVFTAGLIAGVVLTLAFQVFDPVQRVQDELTERGAGASGPATDASGSQVAAASGSGTDGKPRFKFYTMLPEMEVAVPEEELKPKPAPAPAPAPARQTQQTQAAAPAPAVTSAPVTTKNEPKASAPKGDSYVLQIGSFSNPDDAERLKANVALLGLPAHIQTVQIGGGDTWHRVRSGPFRDTGAATAARDRLRQNDLDGMVFRVKR